MTPEGEVTQKCREFLDLCGITYWRVNVGKIPGIRSNDKRRMNGMADIIGIIPSRDGHGIPFALELKAGDNSLSIDQAKFAKEWRSAGGLYVLAHSADELREALLAAGVRVRVR